jgi:hypothetical protein
VDELLDGPAGAVLDGPGGGEGRQDDERRAPMEPICGGDGQTRTQVVLRHAEALPDVPEPVIAPDDEVRGDGCTVRAGGPMALR